MQRFQITAIRPIEVSATFVGSTEVQFFSLDVGDCRGGVELVHRIIGLDVSRSIDIIPHPSSIGAVVTLEDLAELERLPS